MGKHLTPEQREEVVRAFTEDLRPMVDIAEAYNVTRQAIHKIIKRAGIDIGAASVMKVSCFACGAELTRPRCHIRSRVNCFCDYECYEAYLQAGNGNEYKPNRKGQRIARKVVSEFYDLQPGQVVHHEDRDCLNNKVGNLSVFNNQGDHVRYHRLGVNYARPVWSGGDL